MCFNDQRKQEGQFLLFSEHRCPIRMDLEVGIIPHERSHNPHGVGEIIKNGQTNLSIRCSDFIGFPIPGYLQESPPLFPARVDHIPELWRKLLLKGVIEGRKIVHDTSSMCKWYSTSVKSYVVRQAPTQSVPLTARKRTSLASCMFQSIPTDMSFNRASSTAIGPDGYGVCLGIPATGTLQWLH